MKQLLAIALLCFATSALAVDVTVSLTAPQAQRLATAIGKVRNLVDARGDPRSATMAEVKTIIADHLRGFVMQAEKSALEEAAIKAVTVPAFDPT